MKRLFSQRTIWIKFLVAMRQKIIKSKSEEQKKKVIMEN